ncbi:MAG: hypothetical protein EOP33_09875 [Rickettsiaceae bacterium]|nr:MAG: hypothetical protein EOP33_09875 [Rickettsiaceae bacterium]
MLDRVRQAIDVHRAIDSVATVQPLAIGPDPLTPEGEIDQRHRDSATPRPFLAGMENSKASRAAR